MEWIFVHCRVTPNPGGDSHKICHSRCSKILKCHINVTWAALELFWFTICHSGCSKILKCHINVTWAILELFWFKICHSGCLKIVKWPPLELSWYLLGYKLGRNDWQHGNITACQNWYLFEINLNSSHTHKRKFWNPLHHFCIGVPSLGGHIFLFSFSAVHQYLFFFFFLLSR